MSAKTASAKTSGTGGGQKRTSPSSSSSSSSSGGARISQALVKKHKSCYQSASANYKFAAKKKTEISELRPWTDLARGKFKETTPYQQINPPPRKHFIAFTLPVEGSTSGEYSNTTMTFVAPPGNVILTRMLGAGFKSEFTKNMAEREQRVVIWYGRYLDDGTFSSEGALPETMKLNWKKFEQEKYPQWSSMDEMLAEFLRLIQENISSFTSWVCDELLPGDERFSTVDDTARKETDDWWEEETGAGATNAIRNNDPKYKAMFECNRAIAAEKKFALPTTCAAQLGNVRHAIICTFTQENYMLDASCNKNWDVAQHKATERADAFLETHAGIKWSTVTEEDYKDKEFLEKIRAFLGSLATITVRWKVWKLPKSIRKDRDAKEAAINAVEIEYNKITREVRQDPAFSNLEDHFIFLEADKRIFPKLLALGWIYCAPTFQSASNGKVFSYNESVSEVDRAFMPSPVGSIGCIISPGQLSYDPGVTPFGTKLTPSLKITTQSWSPFSVYYVPKVQRIRKSNVNHGIAGLSEVDDSDFDYVQEQLEARLQKSQTDQGAAASSSSSSSSSSTAAANTPSSTPAPIPAPFVATAEDLGMENNF